MKRLLVLATLSTLLLGASGCRWCDRWNRGAYNPCPQAPAYSAPCVTTVPCDPCCSAPCTSGTMVPGPVGG